MLDSIITWAGDMSSAHNIKVERFPEISRPQRKYEMVSVPGRNGDLVFLEDAWNNYLQEYQIWSGGHTYGDLQRAYISVMEWLYPNASGTSIDRHINLEVNGYHQLIDSYEPDVIRLATFTESIEISNSWNRFGRASIYFNCRPERFMFDAFEAIPVTASGSQIYNRGRECKPFIKVYGSGTGTLTVNGYAISITGMIDYLHIDCEEQNCYRQLSENRNNLITLSTGFPKLSPGTNAITFSGGITRVDIWPRWWNL